MYHIWNIITTNSHKCKLNFFQSGGVAAWLKWFIRSGCCHVFGSILSQSSVCPSCHQGQLIVWFSLDKWPELVHVTSYTIRINNISRYCGTHHLTYMVSCWRYDGSHITVGHKRPWVPMPVRRRTLNSFFICKNLSLYNLYQQYIMDKRVSFSYLLEMVLI